MLESLAIDFVATLINFALGRLLSIHPLLELAARGTLVGGVVLVVWFVLSIPIALLHQGLVRHLRTLRVYFWRLAGQLLPYGLGGFERCVRSAGEMMAESKYIYLFDQQEKKLKEDLINLASSVPDFERLSHKIGMKLAEEVTLLLQAIDWLRGLDLKKTEIGLPDVEEYKHLENVRRQGLKRLIIGVIGAIVLAGLNTFLLNEFFSALTGYIVPIIEIPVSLVISVFFSILEFIVGAAIFFLHRSAEGKQTDLRRIFVEYLAYSFILFLMIVEVFFYLALSGEFDQEILERIFEPAPVPAFMRFWLAPMGVAVVGIIAFTGHMVVEGWHELGQSGSPRRFLHDLRQAHREKDQILKSADRVIARVTEANNALRDFSSRIGTERQSGFRLSDDLKSAAGDIKKITDDVGKARREVYAEANQNDIKKQFYIQVSMTVAATLAVGVFIGMQSRLLETQQVFPGLGAASSLLIALIETATVLVFGYASAQRIRIVAEGKDQEIVRGPGDAVIRLAAPMGILAIISFNGFLTLGNAGYLLSGAWRDLSITVSVVLVLFYVGRFLPAITSLYWLLGRSLLRAAFAMLCVFGGIALAAIGIFAHLLRVALYAAAYPAFGFRTIVRKWWGVLTKFFGK